MPFIDPPQKIPVWIKLLVWIGDRASGKKVMPSRILAWYPRALVSSGIFEGLVTHKDKGIGHRLLKLVRMQVSFTVSCPFCIDMNSFGFEKDRITEEEIEALQGVKNIEDVASLDDREKIALQYAASICATPIHVPDDLVERLKKLFSPREIVIIASTAAQVNYWTRLIQAFGIMPAGFTENCPILKLDRYSTRKK